MAALRRCLTASLLLLILSSGSAALAADDAALLFLAGRTVASVEFASDAPILLDEMTGLVAVKTGAPLLPAEVRLSILALYGTGRFEVVEARGRPVEPAGVELIFFLSPRKTLARFSFTGNLGLSDGDLSSHVSLRRGDKVDDEALEEARKRLEDYYSYRGYLASEITTGYGFAGNRPEIEVVFAVKEGRRLALSDIRIDGDPPFGRARALSMIGSRLGESFDGVQVDDDIATLRSWLREKGYFFARVESAVDRSDTERGVSLTFRVAKGDRYALSVAGCVQREADEVLDEVRGAFEADSSPARAQSSAEGKVRHLYQAAGFPFATLSWREDRGEAGTVALTLVVAEGKRTFFGTTVVEGALALPLAEVVEALDLPQGAPYSQSRVDEARKRLEIHYRTRGFLSARPVSLSTAFTEDGEKVVAEARMSVDEGARTLVSELSLAGGEEAVAPDLLLRDLGVRAGAPFVTEELARGKTAILDRLAAEGYIFARVNAAEAFTDSRRQVSVRVLVDAGPRVQAGALTVTGNRHVESRILRVAADLPPGVVLTPETLLAAQKRLYRLGMVESVELSLADGRTSAAVKDLILDVRERNRFAIGLRLGYSNDELFRGEVSLTHRNVGGMSRPLTFLGRAGSLGSLVSATYTIPWFLDRPIDFSLSLSDQIDIKKSYTRDAAIASLTVSREFSPTTTGLLTYSFGGTRLTEVAPGAILSPEDEGKTTIGSITPLVVYDSRDDKFEPRRGLLADLSLQVAATQLGSMTEYFRVDGSFRRFYPLGRRGALAWIARAGTVQSFGQSQEVIIDKRLFLGGQNSVRGYALDTLGPVDAEGKPLGGNYLANLDIEARFPLYRALGGVAFVDSGAVWLDKGSSEERTPRVTAGVGLRWATPIGPFSLDYGHKLDPATDAEDRFYLHFSIGHAF